MKRQIKAPRKAADIKAPEPPKTEIRQFGEAIKYMVDQMQTRWRNQVLGGLHKSTVEKFADDWHGTFLCKIPHREEFEREESVFIDADGYEYDESEYSSLPDHFADSLECKTWTVKGYHTRYTVEERSMMASEYIAQHGIRDAQIGNFSRIYLRLADRTRRKLVRQFDDKRLEKLAKLYTGKVNDRNKKEFYSRIESRVGISKDELEATEGLTSQINAFQLETYQWLRKMRDDTMQEWTSNTLRDMAEGKSLSEILSQFDGMVEKRKNHAEMVARTQISTFNSLVSKIRAQNIGIEKAVWVTSSDERVRPCHDARNGKEFDLAEGLYSSCDGKTLLPGVDYQCFPGSVKINHSSLCQKLYRRWYTGELTELVRDDGVVLHATPNHPIFTVDGFKPASLINEGDNVLCTADERIDGIELYAHDMIPTFEEFFRAVDLLGIEHGIAPAVSGKFHGDISDSDIDVIVFDGLLMSEADASVRKKFAELNLSSADEVIVLSELTCFGIPTSSLESFGNSADSIMRVFDLVRSRLLIHLSPLELFRFALGSWFNASLEKSAPDGTAVSAEVFGDSILAMAALIHGLDFFDRKIDFLRASPAHWNNKSRLAKLPREGGRAYSDICSSLIKEHPRTYKLCRVTDKRTIDFSGHVYNLQTVSGDYIADTTAVSNCRCDYIMKIPAMEDEDNG